jgi:TonB-dependent receptor
LNIAIARQDLSKALVTLALRLGRNIVFSGRQAAGKLSAPVNDARSAAAALQTMLEGSGLAASFQADGSIIVRAAAGAAPKDPASAASAGRTQGTFNPARPPSHVPELVVTGRPLLIYAGLRADRIVSVLTAADMARAPDQNVAEALGRTAGVTVLDGGPGGTNSVPIDMAARGEGNYTSIRGMDPQFNTSLINGVEAAQSQPYSRDVQLNLLPPAGLQTVVVQKSLSADMDGDAIGGVIDVVTPTAFDRSAPTGGRVSVSAQANGSARNAAGPPAGGGATADWASLLGEGGRVGLYLGAYYDQASFSNTIIDGIYPAQSNGYFTYAVQTAAGASAPGLDPARNLVLTGLDEGVTQGWRRRYGGSVALDWRPSASTSAYLRATYANARIEQSTAYLQIYGYDAAAEGGLVSTGRTALGTTGLYQPLISALQPRYYYETNPETEILGTVQTGAAATFGALRLAPNIFVSWGDDNQPNHVEISGREPEIGPGVAYGGSRLFGESDGAPAPLLSAAQLAVVDDVAAYGARRAGELTQEHSNQIKYGSKIDATYELNAGPLTSLSVGAKYQDSLRNHTVRDYTASALYTSNADDPTLGDLGLLSSATRIFIPGWVGVSIPTVDRRKLFALFNANVAETLGGLSGASDQCGALFVNTYNCDTQHGGEATTSIYLMGRLDLGRIEIIPGLRYEHTRIDNTFWVLPQSATGVETPGYFAKTTTRYDEPLPSILLNYRPSALAVYRADAFASYVRPALFQLGGASQIENTAGGAAAGGTTTIVEGNPRLKAIEAINVDLSAEWASVHGGDLSIAAFYKALRHVIYASINSYSNAAALDQGGVVISRPQNGGSGRLFGLELSARQQFIDLPGPLDGLSVLANLTLEHSAVHTDDPTLNRTERLQNQPDVQTNLQLSYEKDGFGANLSYRYVGAYVSQYGALGGSALDEWVRGAERLDAVAAYQSPWGLKVSFSVTNLLNDVSYHATIGDRTNTIPSLVYAGRTYLFRTAYAY